MGVKFSELPVTLSIKLGDLYPLVRNNTNYTVDAKSFYDFLSGDSIIKHDNDLNYVLNNFHPGNWDISYNTSTTYQNTSAQLTPLALTNTLTSQLVKTTDFNTLSSTLLTRTDYNVSSATLLPTTVYSRASGNFATNTLLQSTSALLVTNITFNNYQTSVASSTATLLPTTTYKSASSSFISKTMALAFSIAL